MSLDKILDRVRKLLSLAEHSNNEAEAALAAGRAKALMEEYQLSEALVRLDDAEAKPEPILRDARLEPDVPVDARRKRVAWKETVSAAVARDLGVHEFFRYRYVNGRAVADVRGFGRESAIQTWQYTCQYLWRAIEEMADIAAEGQSWNKGEARAWKGSFRNGCAQRIAERIHANREAAREQAKAEREAATATVTDRNAMALAVVAKDQDEVDAEYERMKKGFTRGAASRIGGSSNHDGYTSGLAAGNRVSLGGGRAGLPAGQGRLNGGN